MRDSQAPLAVTDETKSWWKRHLWKIGWAVTAAWLVAWCTGLFCQWSLTCNVPRMDPNEWGDWAAGTFAPLAFLWLVLGYVQQGEELSQNTRALKAQEHALQLQVKELEASVKAQEQLVEATKVQADASARASLVSGIATVLQFQPGFHPKSIAGSGSSGGLEILLENNTGHVATNLIASVDPSDGTTTIKPDVIPLYADKCTLQLRFTPATKYKRDLLLRYVDALGLQQERRFNIKAKDAGGEFRRMPFVPRLPEPGVKQLPPSSP